MSSGPLYLGFDLSTQQLKGERGESRLPSYVRSYNNAFLTADLLSRHMNSHCGLRPI